MKAKIAPVDMSKIFLVRSGKLKNLAVAMEAWSDLKESIPGVARFRLVVDTNVVLGDLLWLACGRTDSSATTQLMETALGSRGSGLTNIHKLGWPRCGPFILHPNPCMFVRPDLRSLPQAPTRFRRAIGRDADVCRHGVCGVSPGKTAADNACLGIRGIRAY